MNLSEYFDIDEGSPSGLRRKTRPREDFQREDYYLRHIELYAGKPAGSIRVTERDSDKNPTRSCWVVKLHKKAHIASRVIWEIAHGPFPPHMFIDHINGNPLDNRLSNLRLCTLAQNNANRKRGKNNKSGFKGVRLIDGRWVARIGANGAQWVGAFDTPEQAHGAYIEAAKQRFGEFHRAA